MASIVNSVWRVHSVKITASIRPCVRIYHLTQDTTARVQMGWLAMGLIVRRHVVVLFNVFSRPRLSVHKVMKEMGSFVRSMTRVLTGWYVRPVTHALTNGLPPRLLHVPRVGLATETIPSRSNAKTSMHALQTLVPSEAFPCASIELHPPWDTCVKRALLALRQLVPCVTKYFPHRQHRVPPVLRVPVPRH